jgi:succinate-semialdehyde dehydrogenase/glutarate-semialdehyde dehydrogenase
MGKHDTFETLRRSLKDPTLLRTQAFVGGEWIDAADGKTFDVLDPATGALVARVPDLDAAATTKAIAAAQAAFVEWRKRTAKDRGAILRRWYDLMLANQDDLARIMTAEQGKPFAEARGEIGFSASFIDWYAEESKRIYGEIVPTYANDRRIAVIRQPIGVVAAITPWNFPSAMVMRKCAPAIAVGCAVIVKPAEDTPLSSLVLAELAARAGLPKGVLSVVTAGAANTPSVGMALTGSKTVRALSFTGSTEVGKLLMKACADTVKKVGLELGGHAPFIVFDDADLDSAVAGAMASKFRASGQTCVCANRILVQDGVYDAFVAKLADAVRALKVGLGTEDGVTQGPLINAAAVEKVERHVNDAVAKGARAVVGGKRHKLGGGFFEPTLLADVTTDMIVAREETFGPVAPVFRFKDEAEAIAIANDSDYGLAGYFYTRDLARAWRVGEALEYGSIAVNEGAFSSEAVPVGGMKESGIGREGARQGVEEYLETKQLCFAGLK